MRQESFTGKNDVSRFAPLVQTRASATHISGKSTSFDRGTPT
jgi:hypothetical protein